jgi:hypothetical protein
MEREEGASELTEHLVAITGASGTSLPAVLGRAANGVDSWEGLGLISGSTAKDIITALTAFINTYDRTNWIPMMRVEFRRRDSVSIGTSGDECTHGLQGKRTERGHAARRRCGGQPDTALNPSKQ